MVVNYLKVWLKTGTLTAATSFNNRLAAVFFLSAKWLRFGFFIYFLMLIGRNVGEVSGYSQSDLITFYLVFNFFDLVGQLLFRGIYWFSEQIVSGEFDFRLIKPLNPLFQVMTRQTDLLDFPLLLVVVISLMNRVSVISFTQIILFLLLTSSGLLIVTGIHILVAALGVITTEVDHTIMIYRDISSLARFPMDIYTPLIRALLTFVIPIVIAYTYPAQALVGLINPSNLLLSVGIGIVFFYLSLQVWRYALTQYSSASS